MSRNNRPTPPDARWLMHAISLVGILGVASSIWAVVDVALNVIVAALVAGILAIAGVRYVAAEIAIDRATRAPLGPLTDEQRETLRRLREAKPVAALPPAEPVATLDEQIRGFVIDVEPVDLDTLRGESQ